MAERCVCCGAIIPEGRQVCPNCENVPLREKLVDIYNELEEAGLMVTAGKAAAADLLIAKGVTVQRWIPVTERLPKRMANKVIVRCKNDYIGFGHYEDYKGKQTWYNLESDRPFTDWDLEDCESYEVTHWMPLPEPPKGE
jgi:hypothetical protein